MKSTAIKMALVIAAASMIGAGNVATSQAGLHVEVGYTSAPVDVRVWLDRGYDEYYGDADYEEVGAYYDVYPSVADVVLYVRAARNCYATVYVIDTEGFLHVVYPVSPYDGAYLVGGRVYRLWLGDYGFHRSCFGRGVAYAFAVTSPVPFAYTSYGLTVFGPHVGFQIYGDPFIASRMFYFSILPPACHRGVVSVSYARFYVREYVRYPSYLCLGYCGPDHVGPYYPHSCPSYRQYRVHARDPYRVLRPSVDLSDEIVRHTRIASTGAKDARDVRILERAEPRGKDPGDIRVRTAPRAEDAVRNERTVRSTKEAWVSSKQNYERMREMYERSSSQGRVESTPAVKKDATGTAMKSSKSIQRAAKDARAEVTLGDASSRAKRETEKVKRETEKAKRAK